MGSDHSFTLQAVMEVQKSVGSLEKAVKALSERVDKPADANFEYLLARLKSDLGMDKSDVLHTAQSLHHDHAPANRFGLANAWIDRQRLSEGGSWGATEKVETMPTTDFVFFSMREMAKAVTAEAG